MQTQKPKPKSTQKVSEHLSKLSDAPVEIKILPINYNEYVVDREIRYVPLNGEFTVLDAQLDAMHSMLKIGPAGIGKTLSVEAWCKDRGHPLIQFDCSSGTKRQDLYGRFIPIGDDVAYQLGVLPTAYEVANNSPTKTAVLYVGEVSALLPEIQINLHSAMDYRNGVFVAEIGKRFSLKTGHKLLIVASMNPESAGGTHEINQALWTRFKAKDHLEYPSVEQERKIVDWTGIPKDVQNGIMTLAAESRSGVKGGQLEEAISPRTLDAFCEAYRTYSKFKDLNPLNTALRLVILGMYASVKEHKAYIQTRIDSTFRIKNVETIGDL